MNNPALTVLVPFYNEASNVLPLLEEIHDVLAEFSFEVICINDGSDDSTARELSDVAVRWPHTVTVITHAARTGKSAALTTGSRAARGIWLQLIDGDGQNDIRDTVRLWPGQTADWQTSRLGMITGRRNSRNDSRFKWLQSRLANGVRRFVLRDDCTDAGCGWKLIRTDVFRELPYFSSMHRFLPALVKRAGWEVREETVNDRPRRYGKSKYGLSGRLVAGFFDLFGMFWLMRRGKQGIVSQRDEAGRKA